MKHGRGGASNTTPNSLLEKICPEVFVVYHKPTASAATSLRQKTHTLTLKATVIATLVTPCMVKQTPKSVKKQRRNPLRINDYAVHMACCPKNIYTCWRNRNGNVRYVVGVLIPV